MTAEASRERLLIEAAAAARLSGPTKRRKAFTKSIGSIEGKQRSLKHVQCRGGCK
jgi:hypothetical protein